MLKSNVKWELSNLYKMKAHVKSQGRECDYNDDQRIKKLQDFLDSEKADGQLDLTPQTETKQSNEIPF